MKRIIVAALFALTYTLPCYVASNVLRVDTAVAQNVPIKVTPLYDTCSYTSDDSAGDVYDVGSIADGTFTEYHGIAAIQYAMTNPNVKPPAAVRWYPSDGEFVGFWAGNGYDPCMVGIPEDMTVTLP